VFEVGYEICGSLDRQAILRSLPVAHMPKVRMKRNGTVEIDAPGLVGKLLTGKSTSPSRPEAAIFDAINGRSVVLTDGRVDQSNAEAKSGRRTLTSLQWDIVKGRLSDSSDAAPNVKLELTNRQ
jgi:hypothetical protein